MRLTHACAFVPARFRSLVAVFFLFAVSLLSLAAHATPPIVEPGDPTLNGGAGDGSATPGYPKSWVGSLAGVNLGTGNKLTTVPLVSWTARGGLPVGFALFHNSTGDPNEKLAAKWRYSYQSYVTVDSGSNPTIHWEDGSAVSFSTAGRTLGTFGNPTGEHGTLTHFGANYKYVTAQGQTTYTFSSGYGFRLTSIVDRDGNTISIARTSSDPYNVTSITDPTNRTITVNWFGNQIGSISAQGRTWTLYYSAVRTINYPHFYTNGSFEYYSTTNRCLDAVYYPAVNGQTYQTSFLHNNLANIVSITNPRGKTTTFGYNDAIYNETIHAQMGNPNTLTDVTDVLGHHLGVSYNNINNDAWTTVTDPNGHQTKTDYDSLGRRTVVTAALGYAGQFAYDSGNNVIAFFDPANHAWGSTFDGNGNLTESRDPDQHKTSLSYDGLNQVLTVVTPQDQGVRTSTVNTYDTNTGNLLSSKDALNHGGTIHYGSYGLPDYVQDQLGHQTTLGYDGDGNPNYVRDPNGVEAWSVFNGDRSGRKASDTDALGNTTAYSYDEWGRTTRVERSGGRQTPLYWLTSGSDNYYRILAVDYNNYSYFTSLQAVARGVMGYVFRGAGDAPGIVPLYRLSGVSNTDPFYTTNYTEYQNCINSGGWSGQGTLCYVYNQAGANRIPVYRLFNLHTGIHCFTTSLSEYNALSTADFAHEGIACYILAQGGGGTVGTNYEYDPNGNVLRVTDANTNQASFVYDDLDRLTSKTVQRGGGVSDTVAYTYDQPGQIGLLSWKTNGNGAKTTYTYDALDRLVRISYPATAAAPYGTAEQVSYDVNGNIHTRVAGSVNADTSIAMTPTTYAYDNENSLTDVYYPSGYDVAYGVNQHYHYDAASRVDGMDDFSGHTTYFYDEVGRPTGFSAPMANIAPGNTATYSVGMHYDDLNRPLYRTLSAAGMGNKTWVWNYDNSAGGSTRLQNINSNSTVAGGSTSGDEYTFYAYDALGRVSQVLHPNNVRSLYTFDGLGRTTDITHLPADPNATLPLSYQHYEYDAGGRVTQMMSGPDVNTANYTYDGADQLLQERRVSHYGDLWYQYDYTYDHNGNRLSRVGAGLSETYTYNAQDQLTTLSAPGGYHRDYLYTDQGAVARISENGSPRTELRWDFDGHLIVAAPYINGSIATGAGWNEFRYNGSGLRVFKADSGGSRSLSYGGTSPGSALLWDGSAQYSPEAQSERRNGQSLYRLDDALGSAVGQSDGSGNQSDVWLYEAFGGVVFRNGSSPTPLQWNAGGGYQSDADTGFQLLGHRYYDPGIGRFLSRDPAKAGENWYAYCGNDPVNGSDPLGLDKQPLTPAQYLQVKEAIKMMRSNGAGDLANQVESSLKSGHIMVDNTPNGDEAAYTGAYAWSTKDNIVIYLHNDLFDSRYPAVAPTANIGNPHAGDLVVRQNLKKSDAFGKFLSDARLSSTLVHEGQHAFKQSFLRQRFSYNGVEQQAYMAQEIYLWQVQWNNQTDFNKFLQVQVMIDETRNMIKDYPTNGIAPSFAPIPNPFK